MEQYHYTEADRQKDLTRIIDNAWSRMLDHANEDTLEEMRQYAIGMAQEFPHFYITGEQGEGECAEENALEFHIEERNSIPPNAWTQVFREDYSEIMEEYEDDLSPATQAWRIAFSGYNFLVDEYVRSGYRDY